MHFLRGHKSRMEVFDTGHAPDLPLTSAGSDMSYRATRGAQHVPTEFWWCEGRVLLSGLWYGAERYGEPVALPDANGISALHTAGAHAARPPKGGRGVRHKGCGSMPVVRGGGVWRGDQARKAFRHRRRRPRHQIFDTCAAPPSPAVQGCIQGNAEGPSCPGAARKSGSGGKTLHECLQTSTQCHCIRLHTPQQQRRLTSTAHTSDPLPDPLINLNITRICIGQQPRFALPQRHQSEARQQHE